MSDHRYMSLEDRMKIEAWLSEDRHPAEIVRELGVHLSTVDRELKRGGYTAAGASYKDYFYYACKHRLHVHGKRCDYHHQWDEEVIDSAVEEVIRKLVSNPQNEHALRDKISSRIDTSELEKELEVQQKQLRQQIGTRDRLSEQIDRLVYDDPLHRACGNLPRTPVQRPDSQVLRVRLPRVLSRDGNDWIELGLRRYCGDGCIIVQVFRKGEINGCLYRSDRKMA